MLARAAAAFQPDAGVGSNAALDWLTPPIHEVCADDRCRQFQQRFVDIQSSFKADSQLAKTCKPAVRPLHLPAMLAQSLAALDPSSGNPTNDASLPQVGSASLEVVAFSRSLCRRAASMVFYGGVLAGQQSQQLRPRSSRTSWSRDGSHR